MSRPGRLRLAWLFDRRLGWVLLWLAAIVCVAVSVNLVGVRLAGDVEAWSRWLQAHAGHFLVWRLCLYGATAYGWWWMRQRLRQREPSQETRLRLLRTEIAAVVAIAALEGSVLWRHV